MKQEDIIAELEGLVSSLGLDLRYEKGDFKGGDCILYDQNLVVMNKKNSLTQQITLLSRVVGLYGGDDLYMKPFIRQIVDDEMAKYGEQIRSAQSEGQIYEDTDTQRSESKYTGKT
jgi:hypothetical protein